MKSTLVRYLIMALIFAVAVAVVMIYIGGERFLILEAVDKSVERPQDGYKVSLQAVFLGAIVTTLAIIALWSCVRMLIDIPSRLRSGVSKRKRGQALEAMEDALIAASAGDAGQARKKAARARALIDRPALGQIVAAQAAEVYGDPAEAERQYNDMLDNEKTRRVAQRGLATLAYNRGDLAAATSHAQQAYSDNKDAKWAFDILFGAQIAEGKWDQALETLAAGELRKHISKEVSTRRKAVVLTAKADTLERAGTLDAATGAATQAASNMPGFAPGVALAARLLVKTGDEERAAKLIEKA